MKIKILLLTLAVAVSILITQIEGRTEPESSNTEPIIEQPNNNNLSVKQILEEVPKKYNINPVIIQKVAYCESTHNPKAINYNDGGKGKHSVGIMQFQSATFYYWEKKLGEDLNIDSTYDQVKLASYMVSQGQIHQWSCARILNLV